MISEVIEMRVRQSFKQLTAGRWHIVWRSLNADGSENLGSNGVSFVYVGALNPQECAKALHNLVKVQTWEAGVYWVWRELEAVAGT